MIRAFPCFASLSAVLAACSGNAPNNYACADVGIDLGGGCVIRPADPVTRTTCGLIDTACDTTGQGTTTPSLTCIAEVAPPPQPSKKVTLSGFIDVFATGPDTFGITVDVFDSQTLSTGADPTTLTPIASDVPTFYNGFTNCSPAQQDAQGNCLPVDATQLRACDTDVTLGCTQPLTTACTSGCNDGLNGRLDKQLYCRATADGLGTCRPRLRWEERYTLPNVPSDEQIVVLITGANGVPDARFASTVSYNIIASTAAACADASSTNCYETATNTYRHDLVAVSEVDYVGVPQRSGLLGGIAPDRGAIIGEVHDCTGVRIANAQISTLPPPDWLTYFYDGTPQLPVPDGGRGGLGTDQRGLYAAFNLPAGPVTVIPWGFLQPDAPLQMIDATTVRVYGNAITLLNLDGGHYQSTPNQLPPSNN